ncbi:MAG: 50S ribosomal protein L25, partial [Opitutia bacterium]
MKQLQLTVTSRAANGRGPSRRLREAGSIPAVIYGKSGTQLVSVEQTAFRTLMRAKGSSAALIDLSVEGKGKLLSLIKEFQRHPITQKFLHIDLLEIDPSSPMTADIPVRLVGEPVGVRMDGGTLNQVSQTIRVRCLPKDLPEAIEVDVAEMKVDDSIHVGEVKAPAGITFVGDKKRVIAVVTEMAEEEVVETPAAGAAAPAADGAAAPAAGAAAPA